MKQFLRTLVLLIRRTVYTVKRRTSTPLFDLDGHVRVQILTHEPCLCAVSNIIFHCFV